MIMIGIAGSTNNSTCGVGVPLMNPMSITAAAITAERPAANRMNWLKRSPKGEFTTRANGDTRGEGCGGYQA